MFNEANTVEAYVRDLLAGPIKAVATNSVQEPQASYGPSPKGIGWRYAAPAEVPRQIQEVMVEPWLRDALIRLNPEIAAQPDREVQQFGRRRVEHGAERFCIAGATGEPYVVGKLGQRGPHF